MYSFDSCKIIYNTLSPFNDRPTNQSLSDLHVVLAVNLPKSVCAVTGASNASHHLMIFTLKDCKKAVVYYRGPCRFHISSYQASLGYCTSATVAHSIRMKVPVSLEIYIQ